MMLATVPALASLHSVRITVCDATTATAPTTHHQRALMISSTPASTTSTAAASQATPMAVLIGSFNWVTSAHPAEPLGGAEQVNQSMQNHDHGDDPTQHGPHANSSLASFGTLSGGW